MHTMNIGGLEVIAAPAAKARKMRPLTHGFDLRKPEELAALQSAAAALRAGWIEHALVNAGMGKVELWRTAEGFLDSKRTLGFRQISNWSGEEARHE